MAAFSERLEAGMTERVPSTARCEAGAGTRRRGRATLDE
jgi:hypothetical protein